MSRIPATGRQSIVEVRSAATRDLLDADPQYYVRALSLGYLNIGATSIQSGTSDFSWIAKWRHVNRQEQAYIVRKFQGTANPGYSLSWYPTSTSHRDYFYLTFRLGAADYTAWSTHAFPNRRWMDLALTVDRDGLATLWVDGVSEISCDISAGVNETLTNDSASHRVGGWAALTDSQDVCNVGYYDRLLSEDEVTEIVSGGLITDGLVHYWPCNDGADTSQIIASVAYNVMGSVNCTIQTGQYMRDKQTRVPDGDVRLLRLGLFSDLHHGIPPGSKEAELTAALTRFVADGCHAVVGTGDSLDLGELDVSATAFGEITAITDTFVFPNPARFAIGSHDKDGNWGMADFIVACQSVSGDLLIPTGDQGTLGYWYDDVDGDVVGSKVRLVFLRVYEDSTSTQINEPDDGINATETTIPVDSTAAFTIVDKARTAAISDTATGTNPNGRELITYTGTSGNNLTGCTRGAFGTKAVAHSDNQAVYPDSHWLFCKVSQTALDWLESVLAGNTLPVIVLFHYRIDRDWPGYSKDTTYDDGWWMFTTLPGAAVCAYNADEIREVLERHSEVKLVVTGHEHGNHWRRLNGINHLNIGALSGGNCSVLDFFSNGEFKVTGIGNPSYTRR